MKKTGQRKGFALLALMVFGAAAMIILAAGMERYLSVSARIREASVRLQASNLAAEGIEMFRGWASTQTNKDRQDGWRTAIAPLSGKYAVSYGGGYSLSAADSEKIPFTEPAAVEFTRTLEVRDGKLPGEKDVSCAVSWGGRITVQYQVTITDA